MSASQHYVVTGGAGFIGSHLVDRLLREGHRVTVIDDFSTGSPKNLEPLQGTALRIVASKVSECAALGSIVQGADAVFHLAAAVGVALVVQKPIHTLRTNLEETEAVLEAAAANRTPVFLASTSEVYGKSTRDEFSEEDDLLIGPPHLLRWSYACSKLMDEFLALAYAREKSLPVTIVRFFNTVGPRQTGAYGMVVPRFVESARKNEPLQVYGSGEQTRCFCWVGDTVEALLRLLRNPEARGQVVNIGSQEEVRMIDLARLVIELTGSRSQIETVPYESVFGPGFEDMLRRKPSLAKLKALTGFQPSTSLREILSSLSKTPLASRHDPG